jgi:hypothetical protein
MPRRSPLILALVVLVLLAAGCGGGGAPAVANLASTATPTATTAHGGLGAGRSLPRGGGSSATPRSGNHTVMMLGNATQGVKFSACMRAHGEPNFPDPSSQGTVQFGSGIDPRSPRFRVALSACRKLLPADFGQAPTAAQLARVQKQLVAFSNCMRAHAITDFPDPSGGELPEIRPMGDLDPNSPQFQTAYDACKRDIPSGLPGKALGGLAPPPAGNTSG